MLTSRLDSNLACVDALSAALKGADSNPRRLTEDQKIKRLRAKKPFNLLIF
jgi:hypothetical protein